MCGVDEKGEARHSHRERETETEPEQRRNAEAETKQEVVRSGEATKILYTHDIFC